MAGLANVYDLEFSQALLCDSVRHAMVTGTRHALRDDPELRDIRARHARFACFRASALRHHGADR